MNDIMDDLFRGTDLEAPAAAPKVAISTRELTSHVTPDEVVALAPLLHTAQSLHLANEATAPSMLSELSQGLIRAGSLLAAARLSYDKARIERKRTEGRLALEEWPKYCAEKGIKGTEGLREAFVNSHPDWVQCMEQEAYYEALVCQLDISKTAFTMAISSTKSIVYGYRDSSSVTGNRM
jgi:hypothetical protein